MAVTTCTVGKDTGGDCTGGLRTRCTDPSTSLPIVQGAFAAGAYGCRDYWVGGGSLAELAAIGLLRGYACGEIDQGNPPAQLPWDVPMDCAPFGTLSAECPSGGCVYVPTGSTCMNCTSILPADPPSAPTTALERATSVMCSKVQWDPALQVPCCLGLFDTGASTSVAPDGRTLTAQQLCDPRWCQKDPAGVCGQALAATCSATWTNADGHAYPLVVQKGHPCNAWYESVLGAADDGGSSARAFPAVDALVEDFCNRYPDSPACGCFLGNTQKCAPKCVLYSSVSAGGGGGGGTTVSAVGPADGSQDPPIPLSVADAVCLNPACKNPLALQTWDTMRTQRTCPEEVCFQVLEGVTVSIGEITARGIYIADQTMVCKGTPTVSAAEPVPVAGRGVYVWPLGVNTAGSVSSQPIEIEVYNLTAPPGAPYAFEVRAGNAWPAGVSFAPAGGTVSADGGTEPVFVQLTADPTVLPGSTAPQDLVVQFVPTATGSDGSPLGATVQTTVRMVPFRTGVPPQPACGAVPCPDPGQEGRVVIVHALPAWWRYVMYAVYGVLVLGVLLVGLGLWMRARTRARARSSVQGARTERSPPMGEEP